MSDELSPCPTPWCAHPRPTVEATYIGCMHSGHRVKCYGCDVLGRERPTIAEAIAAWNTRPVEDELRAELERLREALARIYIESEDRCAAAIADDALEPKTMELSEETKG